MRLLLALLCVAPAAAPAQGAETLYRTTLYRAAPGRLLELIDAIQAIPAGERTRLILRHSQGDHWDLLVLAKVEGLEAALDAPGPPPELVAWREDTFVEGPELGARDDFWSGGFYHVEMFHALAGRRPELLRQREMEAEYQRILGRPVNALFVRVLGGSWDCFTIGAYRGLGHFAGSEAISDEDSDAAAKRAGFEGADRIGTYLRSLMADHHDTLATPVR